MSITKTFFAKLAIFSTLFISSTTVFAGSPGSITMTFGAGGAESIPSLSGMMLVVLSLLLFAVAFRTAKQKQNNKIFVTLISTGAVLAVLGGAGQLKNSLDVQAGWTVMPIMPTVVNFDNSNSFQFIGTGTTTAVNNDPSLTATITDISTEESCALTVPTTCTVGQTLTPGTSCDVSISCSLSTDSAGL